MQFHVNGNVEASNEPYDMRLQRMLGHLPALVHPNPKIRAGRRLRRGRFGGDVRRAPEDRAASSICEIEPVIPPVATKYFAKENYNVMNDPRMKIVYDDARHYILTSREKFDIITSDPIHRVVKGSATLYTKEYFEAGEAAPESGRDVTLWVPLYESDFRTVKTELATFFEAFPNATIWANTIDGMGYDMVFMGHLDPAKIDIDAAEARLRSPDYALVAESMREIGTPSAMDLFATYVGHKGDLGAWVAGAEINRDRDLRLQYLGGWGINSNLADPIYREMLKYRRLADHRFTGSEESVRRLLGYLASARVTPIQRRRCARTRRRSCSANSGYFVL